MQGDCEKLAGAFTALAAAAGDAGVESAARSAGTSALRQFLNMTSGYQHTAQGLAVCAATYARAESSATEAVTGIGPGRRPLNGLFRPAGDPAALEEAAGSLRSCAGQVAALGASTRSTGGRIAAGADWTGASADAYAQFTSSFAADMEGMEQPLRSVPGAVAGYAAALRSRKAVFTCPWQATDGLYVLTGRTDIKRIRQGLRRFRRRTNSARMALGVFDSAAFLADALLVISNDPGRTESEPRTFTSAIGQYSRVAPVPPPTWLVPIRNPGAFRAAVRQLPQAPPVHDRLPEGQLRFEGRQ